jgi:hypothetical protein
MAMPRVHPAAWGLLGEDGGSHIEADCEGLVPF